MQIYCLDQVKQTKIPTDLHKYIFNVRFVVTNIDKYIILPNNICFLYNKRKSSIFME